MLPSNFFSSSSSTPTELPDSLLRNCPIPLRLNNRIICKPPIMEDANQQQQNDNNSSSCSSEQLELVDEVTEEEEMMLENEEGSDGEANVDSQNNSELTEVDAASEASEESVLYHNERVEDVVESQSDTAAGEDVTASPAIDMTSSLSAMESQTKRPRRIQEYNRKDRPKPSDPRQKRKSTETGRSSNENEQTALPDNNWRMALATALLDLPQFATERPHGTEDSGKRDEEEAGEQAPEKNNQKMPDEAGQQQQHQQQQQGGLGESQNGADHHNMAHFPRGFPSSYHQWSDPRIRLPFPHNFPPSPAPQPLSFFNPPSNLRVVQNQGVGASTDLDLRSALQTPQQEQQSPLFCHPMQIPVPSSSFSVANHYAEEEQRKKQQQIIVEENALLKKQLGKKTDECNSLQGSVKVLKQKLEPVATVQREISKLKNQNCQLTKKLEKALEWEQKWKEKEGTTTKLKKKNEELEKSNSGLKKKNGELEKSNSELKKENEGNTRSLSELHELKRKLKEEQHSKTLELKTVQRKKGEELFEQKRKLLEEHRKIIDELKAEHQKNTEEFAQKEEEQHRKIDELKLNLRKQFATELGKREKQLSDNYQGEIDKLNTKIRMQSKEELAEQRSSLDDQQICKSEHCEQIFKRNTKMIGVYKHAMRKCAKERNCGICKPLLLGSTDEQNAESGVPSSTCVIPSENITVPELIDSLHDVGQRSMEFGMHRTDSLENVVTESADGLSNGRLQREENSGGSQTVEQLHEANEVQTGEECPPSLERSDSGGGLPSITCNLSLFDSFEEIKSQMKERILQQHTGLQSDSPQVEILLQEKMANYNKELKLRHVFMEEPAQQQQQPQPMAEKCPSQSDGTLLPQLTPQITGTTVGTSALSDANNYRQRNPKSARELQELSQLLQASNVQQQQQMFHEPNVVHQNAQNPNPSSSAETVLRQPKRKMERNVLEEQSATMGTEPKYSRHHANCQPQMRSVQQHSTLPIQNFHQQQQNMQSALVGFPQPVSGQQFQPQMTQQHMFSVGPPNQQHMQQQLCGASTTCASVFGTAPLHGQQQMPNVSPVLVSAPQFQYAFQPPPLRPFQPQQQQQHFVQTQQFHQQQRPILRPMMFEPIHQAHILLQQQQQPNSQQGAAQFSLVQPMFLQRHHQQQPIP